MENINSVARLAVNKFGAKKQIYKSIEELNELATALSQLVNKDINSIELINHVYEEMVDVDIMLKQLKIIFKNKSLYRRFLYKKRNKLSNLILKG